MSLEAKWNTNETLLQSYRSIFISSQSFFLAFGAYLFGKADGVLLITCVISVCVIRFIWYPVVIARHRVVDFFKFQIDLSVQKKQELENMNFDKYMQGKKLKVSDLYVTNSEVRNQINRDIFDISTNWRSTRKKMDFVLPLLFTVIWIALALTVLANHFVYKSVSNWM